MVLALVRPMNAQLRWYRMGPAVRYLHQLTRWLMAESIDRERRTPNAELISSLSSSSLEIGSERVLHFHASELTPQVAHCRSGNKQLRSYLNLKARPATSAQSPTSVRRFGGARAILRIAPETALTLYSSQGLISRFGLQRRARR